MTISLSKELTKYVHKSVYDGQYASVSEFFREVLKLWLKRESEKKQLQKQKLHDYLKSLKIPLKPLDEEEM